MHNTNWYMYVPIRLQIVINRLIIIIIHSEPFSRGRISAKPTPTYAHLVNKLPLNTHQQLSGLSQILAAWCGGQTDRISIHSLSFQLQRLLESTFLPRSPYSPCHTPEPIPKSLSCQSSPRHIRMTCTFSGAIPAG